MRAQNYVGVQLHTLNEILAAVRDGKVHGPKLDAQLQVTGYSTDSRSLKKGEAFVALTGENFDGHQFLQQAAERGAALAIVSARRLQSTAKKLSVPKGMSLITVANPLVAYGRIATMHRMRFQIPMIAIAGSNGKTSTKELVADVLRAKFNVLRTEGNLNNLIGVPAMLLRLTSEHTAAVIEIGTNMPGEITKLCRILRPTHGLITNIGREHLELLKSLDGVAREEGALFEYLDANDGIAFVNNDDARVRKLGASVSKKIVYGTDKGVHVQGVIGKVDEVGAPSLTIVDRTTPHEARLTVQLQTPGVHTAGNALAAATVGLTFDVSEYGIKNALHSFRSKIYPSGYARLAPLQIPGNAMVLNDTYNANPDSLSVALKTIGAITPPNNGRRVVVLGDMRELGTKSAQAHRNVGKELAEMKGIEVAVFFGDEMKRAYRSMIAHMKSRKRQALHFDSIEELNKAVVALVKATDVVLVKGSRGMKMERVVAALSGGMLR